jgi:hypothetical protein
LEASSMDFLKRQTFTATPAKPGGLSLTLANRCVTIDLSCKSGALLPNLRPRRLTKPPSHGRPGLGTRIGNLERSQPGAVTELADGGSARQMRRTNSRTIKMFREMPAG